MDRLGDDFGSSLEENKSTPHTNLSCVTTPLSSDRKPPNVSSSPNSREKKNDDNGSNAKSKKRAIEHDETDAAVKEATAATSGLLLLCDTAERQSTQSVAIPTPTGRSSDCVRTVPMPDLFGQDDDGDT